MLHLDSRAPFQELIALYSADNKIGKYLKGEGAESYDFPIELNVKLSISCPHFTGCASFQWPLRHAPTSLSRKSEIRRLVTVENQRKSWQKSEFYYNIFFLYAKEYISFLYICFILSQDLSHRSNIPLINMSCSQV